MGRLTRKAEESQTNSAPERRKSELGGKKRPIRGEAGAGGECALASMQSKWSAAEKARWLEELARAIDEAQQLVWRLSIGGGDRERSSALYGRLEAARDEIAALRRNLARSLRVEFTPEWIELVTAAIGEPAQTPAGMSPPPENG